MIRPATDQNTDDILDQLIKKSGRSGDAPASAKAETLSDRPDLDTAPAF